jgi:hypothetical protein
MVTPPGIAAIAILLGAALLSVVLSAIIGHGGGWSAVSHNRCISERRRRLTASRQVGATFRRVKAKLTCESVRRIEGLVTSGISSAAPNRPRAVPLSRRSARRTTRELITPGTRISSDCLKLKSSAHRPQLPWCFNTVN